MSKICDKCPAQGSKIQDNKLKCLALSNKQRYLVYFHRIRKPANIDP